MKIVAFSGDISYSTIVKAKFNYSSDRIIISPNPNINNSLKIHFVHQRQGLYKMLLINANGQTLEHFTIKIVGENEWQKIGLSTKIISGLYSLIIVCTDGAKIVKKIIVNGN